MELQGKLHEFEAAGVRVYALSYDEPEALADFRDAFGITFTLLSDPDSLVIRDYGILNTLIAEDDHPWFGIPFPGTYVTDTQGRVNEKFFENNLVLRAGPEQLLRAATGTPDDGLEQPSGAVPGEPDVETVVEPLVERGDVRPQVFVDGEQLATGVLRDLVVRFEIPAGRHLYASPAPAGMVAVDLVLDPQSHIVSRSLQRPVNHSHTMAGTAEHFDVHSGVVELRLPVTVNGSVVRAEDKSNVILTGQVRWQVCDDEVCDVPQKQAFEITVPVAASVVSELGARSGDSRVRSMNAVTHFKKMSSRRSESG